MHLVRTVPGKYTDQFGYEHACCIVNQRVEVEFVRHEESGYEHLPPTSIYEDAEGRVFKYFPQAGFGPGSRTFHKDLLEGEDRSHKHWREEDETRKACDRMKTPMLQANDDTVEIV